MDDKPEGYVFGRPTKYRPEYCSQIIEYMSKGGSVTGFAGSIRVSKKTVYQWAQDYDDFLNAIEVARACRVECLETQLLEADIACRVTSRVFALKNADRDEYGEKSDIKDLIESVTKLTRTVIDNGTQPKDPA